MNVIAVTGGIGCGKSTVSARFRSYGLPCIDADAICHELYENRDPELVSALLKRWGKKVFDPDGAINRKAIADIVFERPEELKSLTDLVIPPLKSEFMRRLDTCRSADAEFVLLDVPLLFESGWDSMADVTVAVWAPPAVRLARVERDRGWNTAELERRRSLQMDENEKLERADYGIINSGTLDFLYRQCDAVMERIRNRFRAE